MERCVCQQRKPIQRAAVCEREAATPRVVTHGVELWERFANTLSECMGETFILVSPVWSCVQ